MMILLALLVSMSAMGQRTRIYIEDFEIMPDSTVTVPVILATQDTTVGFQFNMDAPEGLLVKGIGKMPYLSELGMLLTHNKIDGTYVVVAYSMDLVSCPPDTAEVVKIKFQATPEFTGGDVILWKCRGSATNGDPLTFDNDTVHVTVPSSSLISIPADGPAGKQYFNMQGQPISSPDSVPVAIQVTTATDGTRTTRKVAVKP